MPLAVVWFWKWMAGNHALIPTVATRVLRLHVNPLKTFRS